MSRSIDIVGYFGTTFSYATVASRVAYELLSRGQLGTVTNFDDEWHPSHAVLREHSSILSDRGHPPADRVFVVCAPEDHFEAIAKFYGRDRSAIFISPNHDDMDDRHAALLSKFGMLVAPSTWCENAALKAVRRVAPEATVESMVCPLGVDDGLYVDRDSRINRLRRRAMMGDDSETVFLHFSTDQTWDGRKGTAELLVAFAAAFPHGKSPVKLQLHLQQSLKYDATRAIREYGLKDSVELIVSNKKLGQSVESLTELFDGADVVVAPSRSEGFGIMFASALVAGVPLLCTASTGQYDFLERAPGWLPIATGPMVGGGIEAGRWPQVSTFPLHRALRLASLSAVRQHLLNEMSETYKNWQKLFWSNAASHFADRLLEWAEENDST